MDNNMQSLKHCGVCGEKNTYREICWRCRQRADRMHRRIVNKLNVKGRR